MKRLEILKRNPCLTGVSIIAFAIWIMFIIVAVGNATEKLSQRDTKSVDLIVIQAEEVCNTYYANDNQFKLKCLNAVQDKTVANIISNVLESI